MKELRIKVILNSILIINFQPNTLEIAESILENGYPCDITWMLSHNIHKTLQLLENRNKIE